MKKSIIIPFFLIFLLVGGCVNAVVFKSEISTDYLYLNNDNSPVGFILLDYSVLGFGNHNIYWELFYNVTCSSGVKQGNYSGRDNLYFEYRLPIIIARILNGERISRFLAKEGFAFSFEGFYRGSWETFLYIDGVCVDNQKYTV